MSGMTWRGRRVDSLTREELIEAVETLFLSLSATMEPEVVRLRAWTRARRFMRGAH